MQMHVCYVEQHRVSQPVVAIASPEFPPRPHQPARHTDHARRRACVRACSLLSTWNVPSPRTTARRTENKTRTSEAKNDDLYVRRTEL